MSYKRLMEWLRREHRNSSFSCGSFGKVTVDQGPLVRLIADAERWQFCVRNQHFPRTCAGPKTDLGYSYYWYVIANGNEYKADSAAAAIDSAMSATTPQGRDGG